MAAERRATMGPLDHDENWYIAAGLFTIVVYVVAIVGLAFVPSVSLDRVTLFALTGGFFLFMAVYFISIVVYSGIKE